METIQTIFTSDIFRIIVKLLLALVLTGSIGLERSIMNKPAGFGTHAIIGVSACLMVIASNYYANFYDMDVSRIPSQILTGIGFIGAGTIMRNGYNITGITTASGLFAVTCIGMSVGIGYYAAACIATLLVFLLISYSHNISDKVGKYNTVCLNVLLNDANETKKTLRKLSNYFTDNRIEVLSITNNIEGKSKEIQYVINYNSKIIDKSEILATLISYDELSKVELGED